MNLQHPAVKISIIISGIILGLFIYMTIPVSTSDTEERDLHIGIRQAMITDIPYIGIHNNTDEYRHQVGVCDVATSLVTVLEYWYPQQTDVHHFDFTFPKCFNYEITQIIRQIIELRDTTIVAMNAEYRSLDLESVATHLSQGTPLITHLPLTADQPSNLTYYPMVVLTGIDFTTETIQYQSFWHGKNLSITFADYQALQAQVRLGMSDKYLIIKPTNQNYRTERIAEVHFADLAAVPQLDDQVLDLYTTIGLAEGSYIASQFDLAAVYFERMMQHQYFETALPPLLQIWEIYRYADNARLQKDFDQARELLSIGHEKNTDINTPFLYFGPYDYMLNRNVEGQRNRSSYGYVIEAYLNRDMGRYDDMLQSLYRAQEIVSRDEFINEWISSAESEGV